MEKHKWWQKAVFYQIYPRSFADGNGDGIGDLPGMISRLDYLQELGVDAVWLSPIYPSPMFDCGYDISDYVAIAPEYGGLEDFKHFLDGLHKRGLRLILDLVLNHTSHQHPWFLESRRSIDSTKRDWYIWRDGVAGGPPNNWYSVFGGSAWELDPVTGQYYYHYFFKEQPDLNWRSPQVKQAMWETIRFWLDLGVDGFRLDAIGSIYEDPYLTSHASVFTQADLYAMGRGAATEEERSQVAQEWRRVYARQFDQPGIHALLQELRQLVDEYDDRVLVGEMDEITYYGSGEDELHMVFNFPLMLNKELTPQSIRRNQRERLGALPEGAWPCNTLGNHDSSRVWSRYADGKNDAQIARLSLALMLTLRGTPFLYNGEEIGMTDLLLEDLNEFKDLWSVWAYNMEVLVMKADPRQALAFAARQGRDKCRTPFPWENAPQGGFCPPGVKPWLPVNPNFQQGVNLADQRSDPGSLFNFYRRLLRLRQETPALIWGEYYPLHEDQNNYLAFIRHSFEDWQTCLVVLNFSDRSLRLRFDGTEALVEGLVDPQPKVLFSSAARQENGDLLDLPVGPWEIYIAEL